MRNNVDRLVAELVKKVERVRTPNSLVLPYFSDLHAKSADDCVTEALAEVLKTIDEAIKPTAFVDLGDNLGMLGRDFHITNDGVKKTLQEIFDKFKGAITSPLFLINGNHDAVGTDFFKPELWNEVVKGKYDGGLANYHTEGSYYYVDFAEAKTRLVFLSLPYDSDIEAEHPTPLWAYGEEQLKWFSDVALNTEYEVILFAHVPLTYKYRRDPYEMLEVWDGEKTAMSYIRDLCGRIEDRDVAVESIKTFGRVRACFSGHIHTESFWLPYEERGDNANPMPCIQHTVARPITAAADEKLGVFISVPVWNPDEKKLYIFQLGDGKEYEFSFK